MQWFWTWWWIYDLLRQLSVSNTLNYQFSLLIYIFFFYLYQIIDLYLLSDPPLFLKLKIYIFTVFGNILTVWTWIEITYLKLIFVKNVNLENWTGIKQNFYRPAKNLYWVSFLVLYIFLMNVQFWLFRLY